MAYLMLKDLPRYDCLLEAAENFPELEPTAIESVLHILRAGDEVFRYVSEYLEAHQLSNGRLTVLMLLLDKARNEPISLSPGELADQANVTRATMSGLVEALQREGLVEVNAHPGDGRQKVVHMTDKGYKKLQDLLPGHFRRMSALLGPLSVRERKQLVRHLNEILKGIAGTRESASA